MNELQGGTKIYEGLKVMMKEFQYGICNELVLQSKEKGVYLSL